MYTKLQTLSESLLKMCDIKAQKFHYFSAVNCDRNPENR
jgi:hypothetical protein